MAAEMSQASFRPNLVVGGDTLGAWQEDGWVGELRVGETTFVYNRDCTRCVATTVRSHTDTMTMTSYLFAFLRSLNPPCYFHCNILPLPLFHKE